MTALDKDMALAYRIVRNVGRSMLAEDARILRRAELTLHRWSEEECNGTIQRGWDGEDDGIPYRESRAGAFAAGSFRVKIPDREAGALRRVREVCERLGLAFYHQTDPRGCALYVARDDAGMTDSNYSSVGVACCVS